MNYKGYIGHKETRFQLIFSTSPIFGKGHIHAYMYLNMKNFDYKEIINFMSPGFTFNIFNRFSSKSKKEIFNDYYYYYDQFFYSILIFWGMEVKYLWI